MRKLLIKPIELYRLIISPLLGPRCRFYPSCSVYAMDALRRHGALKGGLLAVWRILKCNPWVQCDYHDPAPETFQWGFAPWKRMGYKRRESR